MKPHERSSKGAVFLDRDGTLIEEVEHLHRLEQVHIYPAAFAAVEKINQSGFLALVITNQSAVARGLLSEEELQALHRVLCQTFAENGARLDGIYYCPHHPEAGEGPYTCSCECRKPQAGLLLRAAEEKSLNLATSYMVGDTLQDVEAGHRAGCRSILVRTGYGQRLLLDGCDDRWDTGPLRGSLEQPDFVADDVLEAVNWIVEDRCERQTGWAH